MTHSFTSSIAPTGSEGRLCRPLNTECLVSASVFLFFGLFFAVRSGYSYGAALLLLTALATVWRRPFPALSTIDKSLVGALLAMFGVGSLVLVWHGNQLSHFDQLLRYLLAVPVLLLLLKTPPRLQALWAGVVVGIVASVGIALWQLYGLGHDRASGYLNIIHFGNIGMVFGIFCLCGMLWAGTQGKAATPWRAAFALGLLASVYAIIASGSRGSWVAMPPVVLLFMVALLSRRNAAWVLGGVVALVVLALVAYAIPETGVARRFDLAISEVQRYLQERYVYENGMVSSVGARLEIWRTALMLIPQHLWFGWSESAYGAELQRLVAAGQIDPYMLEMANTHNNYLEVWLLFGAVTLACLLALYATAFAGFARHLRHPDTTCRALALAGSCFVAAYFTFGLSQVILGRNNGVMFFVVTLAVLWGLSAAANARYAGAGTASP